MEVGDRKLELVEVVFGDDDKRGQKDGSGVGYGSGRN